MKYDDVASVMPSLPPIISRSRISRFFNFSATTAAACPSDAAVMRSSSHRNDERLRSEASEKSTRLFCEPLSTLLKPLSAHEPADSLCEQV